MINKRGKDEHLDLATAGVKRRELLTVLHRQLARKASARIRRRAGSTRPKRRFSHLPFAQAAQVFRDERAPFLAQRTIQYQKERLRPLVDFFGSVRIRNIRSEDIRAFQKLRLEAGLSVRTINMEVGILRLMLKRAGTWVQLAGEVKFLPKRPAILPRVLTPDQKQHLFRVAAEKPEWRVAYCAAVLAVSTTCRGIELKQLKWADVDFAREILFIRRSKTIAGHRTIPLNEDAVLALTQLRQRAEMLGSDEEQHFVFPTCENHQVNPTKPQKSWRSAWRSFTTAAGFRGLRFHDLRHQAITELAEGGAPDTTIMAIAGHVDRAMMEHYSHTRWAAKRTAVSKLNSGLIPIGPPARESEI